MTRNNEGGRPLAPRTSKAIDEPADSALRDPITVAMEIAAGDELRHMQQDTAGRFKPL